MKFLPTAIISVLIIVAVLLPGSQIPDVSIVGFDKFVHVGMFGTWALAVRYDFRHKPFSFLLAVGIGLLFSLGTEVLQVFVEGRTFDGWDIAADAVGLLIGFLVASPVLRAVGVLR